MSSSSLLLPFFEKKALALPLALAGILGSWLGVSARYHDPRRGGGEGLRDGGERFDEGEKFNTPRPGDEMASHIRGRSVLNGLWGDSEVCWNMPVAELADGQAKESVWYVAREHPTPDIPRLVIGYAPGIGVLLEKWSSGSSRSTSMIEKSTEGTGDVGRSSGLWVSRFIRSGWKGRSVVVRKGEPRTLDNKREKRGESSGPGFTLTVSGMGRDRFGGGVAGREGK